MSNTAPSRADPVVVFPLGRWSRRWCPPQETSQPHPPQTRTAGICNFKNNVLCYHCFYPQYHPNHDSVLLRYEKSMPLNCQKIKIKYPNFPVVHTIKSPVGSHVGGNSPLCPCLSVFVFCGSGCSVSCKAITERATQWTQDKIMSKWRRFDVIMTLLHRVPLGYVIILMKFCHGCIGTYEKDNFWCDQWRKVRKKTPDNSVSVKTVYVLLLLILLLFCYYTL